MRSGNGPVRRHSSLSELKCNLALCASTLGRRNTGRLLRPGERSYRHVLYSARNADHFGHVWVVDVECAEREGG